MTKTLIVYFTKTGTTAEIAAEIGKALSAAGHAVTIRNAAEPVSLEGYDAVLVGFPINGMKPVAEAATFLITQASALGTRKTAVFAVSYMYGNCRKKWKRTMEKGVAVVAGRIKARSWTIFGGRMQVVLPGIFRFMFGIPRGLGQDTRDWEAIRKWAGETAASLA